MHNNSAASLRAMRAVLATFVGLVAAGCGVDEVTQPSVSPRASSEASRAAAAQVIDGTTGPGSLYRIYMPAAWNGRLVVYAHAAVAPFLPVSIPAEADAYATLLGSLGYAVAASSFSETGGAIKDGAQRTHQLRGLFASKFGQPSRTYAVGASIGGFIAASLAERFPKQYDGAMPLCGVVGGFQAQFSYLLNVRVLFDYLYPGVLPGTATDVPLPSDPIAGFAFLGGIQNSAGAAIQLDARPIPGALQIALIDQTSMPLPVTAGGPLTLQQFAEFVITPLVLHAVSISDAVDRTGGHFPFTNIGTTYTSFAPFMAPFLPGINAGVARVGSSPAGEQIVQQNGELSGRLDVPVLTLHNSFDPEVPIFHQALYQQQVQAAGSANLLVQRTINTFGHCVFTPQEIVQGLSELVAWAELGVKPTP